MTQTTIRLLLHGVLCLVALGITFGGAGAPADREPAVAYTIRQIHPAGDTREFAIISTATRARADLILTPDGTVGVLDAILWPEGADLPIALHSKHETWYELRHNEPFSPRSRYLTPLPGGTVKKVKWQLADLGADAAGERRYKGTLAYEVEGEDRLKVLCDATFEITTTTKLDRRRWLGRILPSTSYPAVDAKLAAADLSLSGFPLRIALSVRRRYEGGPPMEERSVVEVLNIHDKTVSPLLFRRPESYRMQAPVYGVPGQ